MTAMTLEDSFDFDVEASYNEPNLGPTHLSRAHAASDKPPPRKRRRIVVSCTECHRRKQKCDRKLPCTNCVSRHKEDECQYDSGAPTAKEQHHQQQQQQPKRTRRTSSSNRSNLTTQPKPDLNTSIGSIAQEHRPPSEEPSPNNADYTTALSSNVSSITNLGYSSTTTSSSTLHFLHKIESYPEHSAPPSLSSSSSSSTLSPCNRNGNERTSTDYLTTRDCRERYKSLIRQLPARHYLEKLVDIYFQNFNWQYFMLDRDVFDKQLEGWYKVPWEVFNSEGPGGMDADLRVFPGLLLQVLGVSLLVLPEKSDISTEDGSEEGSGRERNRNGGRAEQTNGGREKQSSGTENDNQNSSQEIKGPTSQGYEKEKEKEVDFEALKYAGNMTFENLAKEYSQAGMDILSLLGKREMTLTTVLAGFVRASFLKFVGSVPEAWHAIATTIRDAQELGLHDSSLDPRPSTSSPTTEATLRNEWEIQRRRKIWLNLVSWDIHCGATLGRPSTVDIVANPPVLPIDYALSPTSTTSPGPLIPRTENDPPTPLTRLLFTWKITLHLVSILSLERSAPSLPPSSLPSHITTLHHHLLSLESSIPPHFHPSQPNTTFDHLPTHSWLPWARCLLPQLIAFNYMALHRAYIFISPWSRQMAVEKGCLAMLRAQRRHWGLLSREMRRRTFTLFFGTFDAVVLMGAVFVLFPPSKKGLDRQNETREKGTKMEAMVGEVVRQFKWAEERFEEMKERNPLARQARGVMRGIGERLGRALGEVGRGLRDTALLRNGAVGVKTSGSATGREGRTLARKRVVKPVALTETGDSMTLPTTFVSGTCVASRDCSAATPAVPGSSSTTPGFPTPVSITPLALVQGQLGTATTSDLNLDNINNCFVDAFTSGTLSECIPIDPCLDPNSICTGTELDWTTASMPSSMPLPTLPEDFNWTNLCPLYATGDLVYNDLTGFVCDGPDPVLQDGEGYSMQYGGGGGGHVNGFARDGGAGARFGADTMATADAHMGTCTEDAEDGMVELTRLEHDGNLGQSEPLWMFDGRIDEGSVWGLLNRY